MIEKESVIWECRNVCITENKMNHKNGLPLRSKGRSENNAGEKRKTHSITTFALVSRKEFIFSLISIYN